MFSCELLTDEPLASSETESATDSAAEDTTKETHAAPDPAVSETEEASTKEAPTEEEPTEEPTTCTDEYPQEAIDQLVSEGDDIEKLVFERGPDLHFQYKVVVNKRILRHGEQLAVSAVHCVSGGGIIDFDWLVEYLGHSPIELKTSDYKTVAYVDWVSGDYSTDFRLTIPADMEPGVYNLWLNLLNENDMPVCKIM